MSLLWSAVHSISPIHELIRSMVGYDPTLVYAGTSDHLMHRTLQTWIAGVKATYEEIAHLEADRVERHVQEQALVSFVNRLEANVRRSSMPRSSGSDFDSCSDSDHDVHSSLFRSIPSDGAWSDELELQ